MNKDIRNELASAVSQICDVLDTHMENFVKTKQAQHEDGTVCTREVAMEAMTQLAFSMSLCSLQCSAVAAANIFDNPDEGEVRTFAATCLEAAKERLEGFEFTLIRLGDEKPKPKEDSKAHYVADSVSNWE